MKVPLATVAVVALTMLLRSERAVLIPVVLSVLISYALEPAVIWLERRRVPRIAGAAVVLTAVLAGLFFLVSAMADDALRLLEQLPESVRRIREQVLEARGRGGGLIDSIQRAVVAIGDASAAAGEAATNASAPAPAQVAPPSPSSFLISSTTALLAAGGDAIVVIFLVFFLLLSGDLFRRKILAIAGPSLSRRRATLRTLLEIERRIRRFLLVRLLTGAIVAVATWVGLQWIGLEQAALWGLIAGVCNAIPYLGPVIVSVALMVVALVQFGTASMALYAAGLALLITSLEGWLLDPVLMGRAERMNAVAVLVGLAFWTAVWGGWGAFLAVPMLAIMKSVCDHNTSLRPVGRLLGK